MSARIDLAPDAGTPAPEAAAAALAALGAPSPAADAADGWGNAPALPSDHPAWMRDSLSISQRARALVLAIKPVVVRVLGFFDHRVRSITVGGRTLAVDASGSYRMP